MIKIQEPTENEVKVWAITVGNIPRVMLFARRGIKEAVKIIKKQEGFIGFYINRPYGTFCLFDTENNAKGARNILRYHGAVVDDEIMEVYLEKKYL